MQRLKFLYSRSVLFINKFLALRLSQSIYFFFVKYIYPSLIFRKTDFSLNFKKDIGSDFYKVESNKSEDGYYYNIERSNRYVFGGFEGVGKNLFKKYQLDTIKIEPNDIVIEIGANIGELTSYLTRFNPKIFAIDIESKALECLKLNCKRYKNLKIDNLAIWNQTGYFDFNSELDEASSSLIFDKKILSQNKDQLKKIKTFTLSDYMDLNKIDTIKLLKIEAEGAEPEVLNGAKGYLNKIKFITLDCGPERLGEKTVDEVKKILLKNNFTVEVVKNCCFGVNKSIN